MSKRFRFFVILLVLVIAGFFLYPTWNWYFMVPQDKKEIALGSKEQIRNYAMSKALKELEKLNEMARADKSSEVPKEYEFLVKKAKANYKNYKKALPAKWTLAEVLLSFGSEDKVYNELETHYRTEIFNLKEKGKGILQLGLDLSGGMSVLLKADMDNFRERLGHVPSAEERKIAIDQAIEILNNRIDKFGVTEPVLRKQGDTYIAVEIPGAADPERVNSFLMGKGRLNFHIVDDEATSKAMQYISENRNALRSDNGQPIDSTILPFGIVLREFVQKDEYGIDRVIRYVAIREEPGLDGNHIVNAQVGMDNLTGRPIINFTLDKEGSEIFFKLTAANTERTMAIVLDDRVKAGAVIQEAIPNGQVRMTGFERTEATDLALVLRTAALPVELIIDNQQAVGASLGEDSIKIGLKAIILGFFLVVFFMIIYYKGAGFIADIALVMNLFLMVAILSAFNMTLTMTSIAGLILSVGMAVDANVIIYERIKEELRLGKTVDASVNAGYKKAFWTIMDSNITTLIAAVFLSQLGTGPVQGFAYILAVGIVSSMFTALFVSRLIFDFKLTYFGKKHLSISWRIK
ncbi:MAG: protein translocase subunit SecD [Spirochaetaceae bacterium]|nr:protein translocase subunit SecD [Spirochaetaceae bacterium]